MEKTLHAMLAGLLGLSATYLLWDWFIFIPSTFDSATYPFGGIIIWGAFIIMTLLFALVGPLLIAINESTNLLDLLKGYLAYCAAGLVFLFVYQLADVLSDILYSITANEFMNQAFWVVLLVLSIGILYIIPLFLMFRSQLGQSEVPML